MLPYIEFKGLLGYCQLLTDTHHRSVVPSTVLERLDCFPLPKKEEMLSQPVIRRVNTDKGSHEAVVNIA